MWPLTQEFLEKQNFSHNQTHLVMIDTAQDAAFGNMVWEWGKDGKPVPLPIRTDVTVVGGNGFCCSVVRGEHVQKARFMSGPDDFCHDHNFYRLLTREQKLKALLDWSCVCRHYLSPHEWV